MTEAILDLWRANEDASRLYQLYLCRLQMNGSDERVVAVCPQIRRYAARGPGPAEGLFAFAFEIDSLCSLKDYQTAWRRVRRWEEIVHGQRLDLRGHYWSVEDARALEIYYAPLLYFLGQPPRV